MKDSHPEFGDIPAYDRKVERDSEAKKAHYATIAATDAYEKKAIKLKELIADLKQKEMAARVQYDDARLKLRNAKEQLKQIDTDFRESRRNENARLQTEAAAQGKKTYVTGTPCRNGHVAPRYTSSGACVECDRIGWKDGRLRGVKLEETQAEA